MKVAINLLGLPSVRQGGAGFYAEMLVRGCSELADVRVVCASGVAAELESSAPGAEVRVAPAIGSRVRRRVQLARACADPMRYAEGVRRVSPALVSDCDVVHYPLSFMVGPVHRRPTVVTCVDLQHLEFPAFFSGRDRALRRLRWHRALRVADRVICYSEYVRRSLTERLGVDPSRSDVVPIGCHERFYGPAPPLAAGAEEPFLFYPAAPLPAKNHERLLRAFGLIAPDHPGLRLALSGPTMHDWAAVHGTCASLGLEDRVDFLGHLSLGQLHARYANARCLVFPSLFEGFGIPVLEAMAACCPVAAARVTSVPEVAGDTARLFDPHDVDDIVAGVNSLLGESPAERQARKDAARQRADEFGIAEMARRTLATYSRALAVPSR